MEALPILVSSVKAIQQELSEFKMIKAEFADMKSSIDYLKSDFVAAARKHKLLKIGELGLPGENRVYINDHLTLDNKILLNKTKARDKERGFEHVWVKGCKHFIRKNHISPMHHIKTEHDLKKFLF
ncbi:unnamed protein product [Arctia plantaginis]|uniref:FP protein C-terminal domain-containing protein n=1 Tax=Arctia plantaginis TaxID=874455 RepID=A0A8S1B0K8_ARCPL|nr:unnamed protein product [Arctia plantaginis]